ncbi:bifunctional diaminohydroxyphosphoribosylaminopyrimidine deaminase/5-amino-6-(5-phosphoribosylamino)uracil reductase RibD [Hyphococcus formosus]|uniref:bifunctional diaminohydroxyphosphoribosylaminopyrimidine deaminase/5-amino-6-(5-phosphoribosylamino)uracil reductase RibD n=1 Tax=Hyphococcus formosus TaxID=3143534 RepID=UPI00398B8FBD
MKTPIIARNMSGEGDQHLHFMRRALALAQTGEGRTSPNPMVGCVIVRDGSIIGEGAHLGAGLAHAEVIALKDAGDAKGATAYVTLEPCCHHGRTGPCTEALINAGVTTVYFAVADPHPLASGGGERLRSAGIEVHSGLCEAEAREQNRFWFFAEENKRPMVVAKMAMSLDGRIATENGDSQWITNEEARRSGRALRKSVDAVLVGADTIIYDNPRLTARDENDTDFDPAYQPLRVVIDSTGRTDPQSKVYGDGALLAVTDMISPMTKTPFETTGTDVVIFPRDVHAQIDLEALLAELYSRNVQSLLVEGGSTVLGSFFDQTLVDEVWAFLAPTMILGGKAKPAIGGQGPSALADATRLANITVENIGDDLLVRGRVSR